MPSKICDRTPCDTLRKAIPSFLRTSKAVDSQFELTVVSNPSVKNSVLHFNVLISYCPFCGTRIDPLWVRENGRRK